MIYCYIYTLPERECKLPNTTLGLGPAIPNSLNRLSFFCLDLNRRKNKNQWQNISTAAFVARKKYRRQVWNDAYTHLPLIRTSPTHALTHDLFRTLLAAAKKHQCNFQ